jgi:HB1, ASXL, restriction endonuclease HTH domain
MNSVDAAFKVLQEAGKPLHYAEIARRIVQSKLWLTSGRTPENTVNRDINQEIVHRGKLARFVRLGGGMYAAVPESGKKDPKTMPPDIAFVSDAWSHLPIVAKQEVLRIVRGALTGQTGEVVTRLSPQCCLTALGRSRKISSTVTSVRTRLSCRRNS